MPDPVSVRPVAADDAERPRAPGRDLAGRLDEIDHAERAERRTTWVAEEVARSWGSSPLHDVCLAELASGRRRDANPAATAFYEAHGWERDGAAVTRDFAGAEPAVVRYRRSL